MAGIYDGKEADIEDIFDQTFEYTRTGDFLYVFEDYIREHADAFDVEGDEHRLEWTDIFNDCELGKDSGLGVPELSLD